LFGFKKKYNSEHESCAIGTAVSVKIGAFRTKKITLCYTIGVAPPGFG
jgi:hypothetical protein